MASNIVILVTGQLFILWGESQLLTSKSCHLGGRKLFQLECSKDSPDPKPSSDAVAQVNLALSSNRGILATLHVSKSLSRR